MMKMKQWTIAAFHIAKGGAGAGGAEEKDKFSVGACSYCYSTVHHCGQASRMGGLC
jgi:hypothetical protein